MKKILTLALVLAPLASPLIQAESFDSCESELFSQLKLRSKSDIALPKRDPKGDLLKLVHQYEMLCPWQVERDFNNDRKKDWAGIVYHQGEYQLVTYLSGALGYKLHTIQSYPYFPDDAFLESIPAKRVIAKTGNRNHGKFARYSLLENRLKSDSRIFTWNSKKMEMVLEFNKPIEIPVED